MYSSPRSLARFAAALMTCIDGRSMPGAETVDPVARGSRAVIWSASPRIVLSDTPTASSSAAAVPSA